MSDLRTITIDTDDPAVPINRILRRLRGLANEQEDIGSMALYYVLEDMRMAIEELLETQPSQDKHI